MINFSLVLSLKTPKGSWVLLPEIFLLFQKNVTRFTLVIYLLTLELIRFICKSFDSSSLKSFFFLFLHRALFSITSFLQQSLCFLFFIFIVFTSLHSCWCCFNNFDCCFVSYIILLLLDSDNRWLQLSKTRTFLLVTIPCMSYFKSELTFYTIIIYSTKIFRKKGNFEIFLKRQKVVVIF